MKMQIALFYKVTVLYSIVFRRILYSNRISRLSMKSSVAEQHLFDAAPVPPLSYGSYSVMIQKFYFLIWLRPRLQLRLRNTDQKDVILICMQ
jgi:hypothetical protein